MENDANGYHNIVDCQSSSGFNRLQLVIDENSDATTSSAANNVPISTLSSNGLAPFANENELPNQISSAFSDDSCDSSANYTELTTNVDTSSLNSNQTNDVWKMNYNEAAIYLEEGYNNDKFDYHPKSRSSLPAYLVVHNTWFYLLDLFATLLLLSLAFFEKPAVDGLRVKEGIHASLELLALSIIGIELFMKYRWMKIEYFLRHTRTAIKLVVLLVMISEALIVLIRRDSHFRVTRALRPVFLIDNHYCGGIRRVVRQIIQSLPPFLDMLFLLFFFMLIFSILGFYLFSSNLSNPYFSTIGQSFVSLFVLLTTANFPDVMMPSYKNHKISSVFFVAFLIIHLYFLMNIMLAVVYEAFTRIEKEKFRKLLLHRRKACRLAFGLLVTQKAPKRISYKHFEGLMKYYKPSVNRIETYLMFKILDTNRSGFITLDEFYGVYEVSELNWELKPIRGEWFADIQTKWLLTLLRAVYKLIENKWFRFFVYLLIGVSSIYQIIQAIVRSDYSEKTQLIQSNSFSLLFVCLYALETSLKLIGFGLVRYFKSFWNRFDFAITCLAVIGLTFFGPSELPFNVAFVLRSIRLLELLQQKRRFKDIMGAFIMIIVKRFVNLSIVVLIVYYMYAILGMELFSTYNLQNCCKNTSIEQFFVYSGPPNPIEGYYYLNNFQDVISSYVTLFELMVVNNWYVLMEGYVLVSTEWSRLYFMTFYIITLVVLTIIVAFVLETFLFRIQYRYKMGDIEKDTKTVIEVSLNSEELKFCTEQLFNVHNLSQILRYSNYFFRSESSNSNSNLIYKGIRGTSKFSLSLRMYFDEIKDWTSKEDEEWSQQIAETSNQELDRNLRITRRALSCA